MKVAIDGPAGSGKSTVAKLTAQKLGFKHIDTGAYYRWVTYNVLHRKISFDDISAIVNVAREISYQNIPDKLIRSLEVSNNVSTVSAIKEVRPLIVEMQRETARNNNIVMEGRDIGSVVFPDAEVKIYLNASVEERARRRYQELVGKNIDTNLETIKKDIINRDKLDMQRKTSPLKKSEGAIEIDTTGMSIEKVIEKIAALVENKQHQVPGSSDKDIKR